MPGGGTLGIETANVELDGTYVESHVNAQAGPHVMLAVSDTGTGMSKEVREHIFEPFYTTKERDKGTGLGLATVYGIVKQYGGEIYVYSEPGIGTTFKLYFPRQSHQNAVEPRIVNEVEFKGNRERVLIVDDDFATRNLIAKMLEDLDLDIHAEESASSALEAVGAGRFTPELLITDMIMPDMSGGELAKRLEPALPNLRVLYISGYTDKTVVRHGILEGGTAFLAKPFTRRDLAARVGELLAGVRRPAV